MASLSRSELRGSSDPACAAESSRGPSEPRFSAELEKEYTRAHLFNSRMLIRLSCLLAAMLVTMRGMEHVLRGAWSALVLPHFALVFTSSIVLAWIAWTSSFDRFYLPCAQIIVPVRNSIIAAHFGYVAGLEELMLLPFMVVGPFFFLGLPFRTALITCTLTVTSFVAAAFVFAPSPSVSFRIVASLILTATVCAIAARYFEQASRRRFLEARAIAEFAELDALTGTRNRRVFDEHLARTWRQAIRERCAIAVLLIDVDHFKAYNDRYGHQAGDLALRRVAQALQTFVRRPLDILARYGGEEFAAVLYDIATPQALEIADGMRRAAEGLAIEHAGSRTSTFVTASVGVAVVEPDAQRNPRSALQLADEALYVAKHGGRNRVAAMGQAEYESVATGVFTIERASTGP